ncbi:MAG: MBOAT family protein [Pirellulales bacterium]
MTFTSLVFLLFLPTVLAVYWLLGRRSLQNSLLVLASYFFYGWWDVRFCGLMLISSLVDFGIGLGMDRSQSDRTRKWLLWLSIGCNLGLLAAFKYANFFLDSFRQFGDLFGFNMSSGTLEIVLPVGISFYTFQTLSYTIDIYRRRLQPTKHLVDYLAFVSFFPQLVAGPIERASRLLPQFQQSRSFDGAAFACGLRRILWGFFKKIVIADSLAGLVTEAYANPASASGPQLFLATVLFSFQIYCDFSAYSDIAIGTARLFNIRLMQNFAYPYFSQSLGEFWQRWHISLSTWFRDYVYIPLGGNRGSAARRGWNVVLTFLVSGLWHGAAWRFVAWGALHGATLTCGRRGNPSPGKEHRHKTTPEERPGGERLVPTLGTLSRMLTVFVVVCLFWVFFRANSLADALLIFQKIVADIFNFGAYQAIWQGYILRGPLFHVANVLIVFVLIEWCHRHMPYPLQIDHWPKPSRWVAYTLVFWFVAEYADTAPANPFIYFQF